jgi:hypothetical protein
MMTSYFFRTGSYGVNKKTLYAFRLWNKRGRELLGTGLPRHERHVQQRKDRQGFQIFGQHARETRVCH